MTKLPSYSYSMLLPKAYRTLRGKAYEVLGAHGLTPTHWSLLGIVYSASSDGATVTEVTNRLNVKMPLVTVMIDQLVENDFVTRTVNPKDSRSKLIRPTINGRGLLASIQKELQDVMDPLFVGISDAEMDGFQSVLEKIIANDSDD